MRLALLAIVCACKSSTEPAEPADRVKPQRPPSNVVERTTDGGRVLTVETDAGPIDIHVAEGPIPANAEMMCSDPADYTTYPRSQIHVVPTYIEDRDQYVGSFRCNTHWKKALAETRARLAKHPHDVGALLEVILARGVTEDRLRAIVSGKDEAGAAAAVLDAIEAGTLVLEP